MKEKLPDNLKNIGPVMSNFDHAIEAGAEEKLKSGDVYGEYPAWDFWAAVWWDNAEGKYKAMVKQYQLHVDTLKGDNLKGIMEDASELYGAE